MGNCACSESRRAASRATDGGELMSVSSPGQQESSEVRRGVEVTVTIRISKRRLHELLVVKAASGGERVTAEEKALVEILNAGEVVAPHRRRWEPQLQSIPEAVES